MKINLNSRLIDYINTILNFIGLNLVFIICCIPIITIGPALVGLYEVALRENREEHGYLIKPFVISLYKNFFKGFCISIIIGAFLSILLFSLEFWSNLSGPVPLIISIVGYIMLILLYGTFLFAFPLTARFDNTIKRTLTNSMLFVLTSGKYTILLLLINILIPVLVFFISFMQIFMLVIGFAFIVHCNSYIFCKIFYTYENPSNIEESKED